jgi:prephenate dehydrogenase
VSCGTVVIVGVGLIGGSIGKALRESGLARRVIGVGRDTARLELAQRLGAIDDAAQDDAAAYAASSVAVVCTPVSRVAQDVCRVARYVPDDALIMDVGSTKRVIVETVERDPRAAERFLGAHPIAGSDRSGVEHARADLFRGSTCVLTPTQCVQPTLVGRAADFWTALGCHVLEMSPEAHDQALAHTSHAPHLVASALSRLSPPQWHALAGGAFRDMTRVAGADTELWVAVFRQNRAAVLHALDALQTNLAELRHALTDDDPERLAALWEVGRAARSRFVASDQLRDPKPPPSC